MGGLTANGGGHRGWLLGALALVLAFTFGLPACGGSSSPTFNLGFRETPEEEILAQIYAQALEHAGFNVGRVVRLGPTLQVAEDLKAGRIAGLPGYLNAPNGPLYSLGLEELSSDPHRAYRQALEDLKPEGLTAFTPTAYSRTNLVGARRDTAEERHLKTISDLEGQSRELTITGGVGCHGGIDCVGALEQRYKLSFNGFVGEVEGPTEPFEFLELGRADLAMLPSTDGRLSADREEIVTLEDDKHLFPAGNAMFVTTPKIAKEMGTKFNEAIVTAQKGLILPVIQELDAQVEIEHEDPQAVAAEYLKRTGIID